MIGEAFKRIDQAAASEAQSEYDRRDDPATVIRKGRAYHGAIAEAKDVVLGHWIKQEMLA